MSGKTWRQEVLAYDIHPADGRRFWFEGRDTPANRRGGEKPTFRIAEVTKVFFARSPDWMRWLIAEHDARGDIFLLDGEELSTDRTPSGARVYTLSDIEKVAVALHQNGRIRDQEYLAAMSMLRWVGAAYKIIPFQEILEPIQPVAEEVVEDQLVIPGLESEEASVIPPVCDSCLRGDHADCMIPSEIAFNGEATTECVCYTNDVELHGETE